MPGYCLECPGPAQDLPCPAWSPGLGPALPCAAPFLGLERGSPPEWVGPRARYCTYYSSHPDPRQAPGYRRHGPSPLMPVLHSCQTARSTNGTVPYSIRPGMGSMPGRRELPRLQTQQQRRCFHQASTADGEERHRGKAILRHHSGIRSTDLKGPVTCCESSRERVPEDGSAGGVCCFKGRRGGCRDRNPSKAPLPSVLKKAVRHGGQLPALRGENMGVLDVKTAVSHWDSRFPTLSCASVGSGAVL